MFLKRLKTYSESVLEPVSKRLSKGGVSPDHVSVAGVLMSIVSGGFYCAGMVRGGALFLALSGFCDLLDGNMARTQGLQSRFGAFLDSTLDRYSDMFVLFGVAGYSFNTHDTWLFWWTLLAILGSFMVSYTRARAECIIDRCDVGVMERPERIVVLIIFSLAGLLVWGVALVALLANFTAFQRMYYTWKRLRGE